MGTGAKASHAPPTLPKLLLFAAFLAPNESLGDFFFGGGGGYFFTEQVEGVSYVMLRGWMHMGAAAAPSPAAVPIIPYLQVIPYGWTPAKLRTGDRP